MYVYIWLRDRECENSVLLPQRILSDRRARHQFHKTTLSHRPAPYTGSRFGYRSSFVAIIVVVMKSSVWWINYHNLLPLYFAVQLSRKGDWKLGVELDLACTEMMRNEYVAMVFRSMMMMVVLNRRRAVNKIQVGFR